MKKLFFHIGMPKCGSTSIQNFMAKNRKALLRKGCCYPEPMSSWAQHVEIWPGYVNGSTGKKQEYPPQHYISIYEKAIEDSTCATACLSSELFSYSNKKNYDFITHKYDTSYIVYVRSPLEFAQSRILFATTAYVTLPKWKECRILNTNDFINNVNLQHKLLDIFCEHDFSSGNFIFKDFESCKKNGNLINDFCKTIGIDDISDLKDVGTCNDSLKTDYVFFIAHTNMIPLTVIEMKKIISELRQLSAQDTNSQNYRIFSKAQIASTPKDIIKRYNELGKRINIPDLWQRGVDSMLALEECPYRQLPTDRQHDIFAKLSPESQRIINNAWQSRAMYPGTLRGDGFLPDIPEDEKTAHLMRQWSMRLAQESAKGDTTPLHNTFDIDNVNQLQAQVASLRKQVQQQNNTAEIKLQKESLEKELSTLQIDIDNILHSKSWKITYPLRKIYEIIGNNKQTLKKNRHTTTKKRSSNTASNIDKFIHDMHNLTLLRTNVDAIDPEKTVIMCMSSHLKEAITYYTERYPTIPEFRIIDWEKYDNITSPSSSVRVLPAADLASYTNKNKCLFVPPFPVPWQGFTPAVRQLNEMGITMFDVDVHVEKQFAWIRNTTLTHEYFENNIEKIAHLYSLLEDNESKLSFLAALKQRLTREIGYFPLASYPEYFHPQVPIAHGDTLIEGGLGAYIQPTIIFSKSVGSQGKVVSFEPIPDLFSSAKKRLQEYKNITVENYGLWDKEGKATFQISSTDGSRIATQKAENQTTCELIDIDTYIERNKLTCNFLKLDIEGSELTALHGAVKTLKKYKPKLAICLYHRPSEQLITIFDFIQSLDLGYTFYIGHHTPYYTDTILYAINKDS
ncbi:FkbM family methyltransferase [Desulfovibrio sp. OttesenSCG-928-I05]|nr:FkbM family methyltransferase [Desulfovibrio sp. OttesenSCG-928-I05]